MVDPTFSNIKKILLFCLKMVTTIPQEIVLISIALNQRL